MRQQHNQALIIFVKNPMLGTVKTRLAKTIGDEKALDIYHILTERTRNAVAKGHFQKFVFYANFVDLQDDWDNNSYQKYVQQGNDLGERMQHAFDFVLNLPNIEHACIIGSDCPKLDITHLNEAFEGLKNHDCVIGPALDGGYYLLGMNTLLPNVFQHKQWSTAEVLPSTLDDIQQLGKSYLLLPELSDLDTETDLYLLD